MSLESLNILGVSVCVVDVPTLHQEIATRIETGARVLIPNVNVHCLYLAQRHGWLRDFLNSADIVFCDGAGVQLGARLLDRSIPDRITYADWMWQLAEFAETRGYTFFLLGARPGVANDAAKRLRERFPALRIVGTHHGYFDKTPGSRENDAVIERINAVKPNILILGLGMPLQEQWLMQNWERVEANVALTGGAVFDYVSGNLRRPPRWMTDNGLEWLGRLIIEPGRLWKRYLVGNPLFLWHVWRQRQGRLNR